MPAGVRSESVEHNAERTVIGDRFVLEEQIGAGGIGVVWRAHDTLLQRTVAVKKLQLPYPLAQNVEQELRSRALREARAAARLNHPGAVTVYDAVRDNGEVFVVMEYVEAPTLQKLIDQDRTLQVDRVARIGTQVAEVLEHAHRCGLVHRDIKPANLLVLADGRVKVADFGITRMADQPAITRQGVLFGSPAYVAPEQLTDMDGTSAASADWRSLAATLYHSVEGRLPFPGRSTAEIIAAVLLKAPEPPLLAGAVLGELLLGLLDKQPANRPNISAIYAALAAAPSRGTTTTGMLITGRGTHHDDQPSIEPRVDMEVEQNPWGNGVAAKVQYHLACVRQGCGLPLCQLGCQYRVDTTLVGEADHGRSTVAGSLIGLAFHREAVVPSSFDHTRVGTMTKGIQVPLRGDLTNKVDIELLLMIRGKNRPDPRWCRGPAGRSG
jgi:serine/threonine protein kinase